jgi:hypothetical protein
MGETRNAHKILVAKPEVKRLLRKHMRNGGGDIKTDLKQNVRSWTEFLWLMIDFSG